MSERPTAVGLLEPDDRNVELGRLRDCLWFALARRAYLDGQILDAALSNLDDVAGHLARIESRRRGSYQASGVARWAGDFRRAVRDVARALRGARA